MCVCVWGGGGGVEVGRKGNRREYTKINNINFYSINLVSHVIMLQQILSTHNVIIKDCVLMDQKISYYVVVILDILGIIVKSNQK